MLNKACKNVLVRGVNWVGDAVMTFPALRALRKALPEARISLLVKPWVSPLFEQDPHVDETIIYGDEYKGTMGKIKMSRMLRKKGFCSAILFQNAFDAAFISFLAGIKERAGYNRDARGFLLTTAVAVPHTAHELHHIFYYLNLLEQLGIKTEFSSPYIYLSLAERLSARELLKDTRRPILGINPGAAYGSAKRWFPERFAEVANWFLKDTGGSVVIFGGKGEVDIAQEIDKLIPENKLLLAGKTSLRELVSLISECDVFVTNDSGPLHIAYAVGTPLVAIFGSTDPKLTGPPPQSEGIGAVVVTHSLSCGPCFERTCEKNDMRCMYDVTSDDVYLGIKKILPDRPAVFFDRDGTLCKDAGYLNTYDNLEIFPDVSMIRLLREKEFKLIGVSNQSGIARGLIREDFVREVNNILIDRYGFDDFYFCPHYPADHCPCRKPEPGMLLKARARHRIDFKKSFVVGDKETDMLLAHAVGAKGVFVKTGQDKESPSADYTAKDLSEAVNWILEQSKNQ
jgi:lipopolysaccharide heptosyltransferase II